MAYNVHHRCSGDAKFVTDQFETATDALALMSKLLSDTQPALVMVVSDARMDLDMVDLEKLALREIPDA